MFSIFEVSLFLGVVGVWVQGGSARRNKLADVCFGVVFEISKGLLIADVAEVKV